MSNALIVCATLLVLAGCGGGGGSTPTPTAPAPIPAVEACNLIGGVSSSSALSILNGTACDAQRSSVVLLNMRTSDGVQLGACSGTIVMPRVILTAAHCLDEGAGIVRVFLGTGLEIVAQSFVFFPNYRFNQSGFDVGVVFMAEDLPRNSVPILTSRNASVGETAVIAGWGRDQSDIPSTLRAGSTRITAVSSSLLETPFAPPSSSVCSGDSGGPILLSEGGGWAIAGITSATSANVCNTGTNFFQAVRNQNVRDFILSNVPNILQR